MKIWDLSIKKPISVFMGLVCIVVLGLISFQRLKLAFLPEVDFPAMWVWVSYPNQNPEVLEKEVTRPLEEGLATLKGVKKISSQTEADQVVIQLNFNWGMELDLIRLELGLKIEEIKPSLPSAVRQISIFSFNTEDIPLIEARISAPGIDLSENYDLIERHIKQKIERIPGVAQVELGGVLPKEVYIELKLDKINAHNVDVGDIVESLARDNLNLSSGKIRSDGLIFNVRGLGRIENIEEFKDMIINDQGLRLRDIADVLYEEPPIGYKRHLDGDYALALEVKKDSTANTVEVTREVNRVITEEIAQDPLLKGISLLVWNDQGKEITNGLDGLTEAGLYGALFAVLVLFLFLRQFSATLIVATAIPISLVGSFIFLYALGYTLNVLTMMGLMLAVGMLVDNAVVVLESIYQKSLAGKSAIEATREGTREVIVALIAATSTTMIVFLSLTVSDKNQLTVWLSAIGLTICITLFTSLIVSTTVIPLFASKMLKRTKMKAVTGRMALIDWYSRVLDWSLGRPKWTMLILILLLVSIAFPVSQLGKFEGSAIKTDQIRLRYEFNDFFFLSDAEKVVNQVEAFLETKRETWQVRSIYSYMQENFAATTISFTDETMPVAKFKEFRKTLREELPKVPGVAFRFEDDENDSAQAISVQLFGTETQILKVTGEKIAHLLEGVEGLVDIRPGERNNGKELRVSVDREQANIYGVNPETISQVFGFTLGSTNLPRFQNGERESDVSLGLRIEDRATIDDISQIRIAGGIPLGTLAKFEFVDSPVEIYRVDRKAHYSIRATYEGEAFKDMMETVEARLNHLELPAGVSWSWNDRILREQNEMQGMLLNVILALILVYLVMASLFESLIQPLLIFTTILFSTVGTFWFLYFTRTEFHVMAMIGMMILIGIVVNNGIIMMDRINHYTREGMDLVEAVRQGAHDRIRPILMTASTTVIGLLPMAMGSSSIGDGYYYPLARTVIGGLTSSTLLTLLGLPIAIILTDRLWKIIVRVFKWLTAPRQGKARLAFRRSPRAS